MGVQCCWQTLTLCWWCCWWWWCCCWWCRFQCCTGRAHCCRLSGRVPAELQACCWCLEQRRGAWGMAENWRWAAVRKQKTQHGSWLAGTFNWRFHYPSSAPNQPGQPHWEPPLFPPFWLWRYLMGQLKRKKTQGRLPLLSPAPVTFIFMDSYDTHTGALRKCFTTR